MRASTRKWGTFNEMVNTLLAGGRRWPGYV
jgi:hypothetical protein